jgi:hypothetical protein
MVYTFHGQHSYTQLIINSLHEFYHHIVGKHVNPPNKKSKRQSFAFFVIHSLDS